MQKEIQHINEKRTFALNIIIKVLRELYKRQGLSFEAQVMAPTGQAAQVAHKAQGCLPVPSTEPAYRC